MTAIEGEEGYSELEAAIRIAQRLDAARGIVECPQTWRLQCRDDRQHCASGNAPIP